MTINSHCTWERQFPTGAWRVYDDRLYDLTEWGTRSFTYYGYTKREAMAEHANHVKQLQRKKDRAA